MIKRVLELAVIGAGLFVFGVLALSNISFAQQPETPLDLTDYRATMIRLLGDVVDSRRFAGGTPVIEAVGASDDPLYIAPLIDLTYFARTGEAAGALFNALSALSGQDFDRDWTEYQNWAASNDITLPPGYDEFKGLVFTTFVDPEFARFFNPGVQETARVNLLEAVWGGVIVDGIPSLVNARQITPEEATAEGERLEQFCRGADCSYPANDEFVFGVSIDGDSRAYPLRLLNWHEMFNDVIGSAPLYDAPDGEVVCNFRAPTEFSAVARQGSEWVQVFGQSAGCPASGWFEAPETLVWAASWDDVQAELPDLADDPAEALAGQDGVRGQVDGTPVMLAYCTLCGSGVLYDATVENLVVDGEDLGTQVLEFGSTGMLMRSNKLMYDRTTDTVWNALTGVPAFGPLAETDITLERLPVVVTDWASWQEEHPDTSVLSLTTGFRRDYTNGGAYSDYFNDADFLMFPVWQQDTTEQENKEVVFALLINDTPKAYPLETIVPETVVNDTLAGEDIVIVARATPERDFFEPGGAAVRAYERGDFEFSAGETEREVVDQNGDVWSVTEAALVGPDGQMLERLPGHLAFWFGWFGFYPETLVYEPTI
ncbi:MAG: DUF3179 domain-containing protein [Chloroflexi bacterium]|nr:DUF3179 domain-containing protein [Chloroflexota bacterium]